jgi:beta-phosphoglucomutase
MDGTLVDSAGFHTQVWLQVLADLGVHVTAESFHRQTSGKTNPQILRQMLGSDLSVEEMAQHSERKEMLYRAAYRPHLKLLDGLDTFLREAWHLGLPMAVATSADRANIDFVLGGLGIEDHFDAIVGAEDVSQGKPHPEGFLAAASKLEVAPGQCLVFEDSLTGIEAAHHAGMKAIAVTTTVDASEFEGLPAVTQIVEDFTSLTPSSLIGQAPEKGS